ncbi:MAG TPA: membrane dipeptidase [Thermoanaerobaculia bacterium]|jgi:membrane dipeptidase|nr:membrane dipeptidase [Thermoanaerobaculia bacterium]
MRTLAWALAATAAASFALGQDSKERALALHRSAIVVDTHEDVPERLEKEWVDLSVRGKTGHVDIPRWREGGVTAPFLAAYVNGEYAKTGGSAKKALEFIDLIHRLVDANPKDLVFADSVSGIRQAKKDGKVALLIGIEGGHAIEDSLGALSSFYRLGVRYMTLTHTNTNHWADSSGSFFGAEMFEPSKYAVHDGLTEHGREVVLEMNRLGMLVDVSHVSDKTMADAIAVSKAPVFASHSSCRALSNLPRNVTDDQIRAIAKGGGVVMVNLSSLFLDQKAVDAYVAAKKALQPRIAEARARWKGDPKKRDAEIAKLVASLAYPRANWSLFADHIEHVMAVGGPQAAGVGTDFDGIEDPPIGLEDVSQLPKLTEELLRRGHSDDEVRGVLGENFLRFWDRAEAARRALPASTEPLPFSKPGA